MTGSSPQEGAAEPFVHEGLDGWLFLQGGTNYVTSLYSRDSGNVSDAKIAEWKRLIENRSARSNALGIACAHIIVPDKLTVYGDRQSTPLVDIDLAPSFRLAEEMRLSSATHAYIDLVAPMRTARHATDLYWKTDTHWTPEGCLLAYTLLCERLGLVQEPDLLERPCRSYQAQMDLGWRVQPPRWEKVRKYNYIQKSERNWVNSVTAFLEDPYYKEEFHTYARARFVNASARNNCSALIFGDSYSRPSPDALTGMLAETMRSVEFIWSSSVDWTLVNRMRPDILIVQTAERFLARLPNDRRSLRLAEARQYLRATLRTLQRSWRDRATKSKEGTVK